MKNTTKKIRGWDIHKKEELCSEGYIFWYGMKNKKKEVVDKGISKQKNSLCKASEVFVIIVTGDNDDAFLFCFFK